MIPLKQIFKITVCCILTVFVFCSSLYASAYAATDISKIHPDYPTMVIVNPFKPGPVIMTPNSTFVIQNYPTAQDTVEETTVKPVEHTEESETSAAISVPVDVPKPEATQQEEVELASLIDEIFNLTNDEREKNGLEKLTYSTALQKAADVRAEESAVQFSHTRPDGTSCHTVVEEVEYNVTGENLLKADKPLAQASTMVNAWMNSEGHRANILLPEYRCMAVGLTEKDGVIYAVQIFLG